MKAQFTTKLRLEWVDDELPYDDGSRPWRVFEPLRFYSAELKRLVQAPAGLRTDLYSIPFFGRVFYPQSEAGNPASVIHDAAYQLQLQDKDGLPLRVTKEEADALLREGMRACGVNSARAWLFWKAVRVFGQGEFQKAVV